MPCRCSEEPIGEGGYGDIMVIETRWMVVEICLFVSKEPLINPENGGSGAGIIDLSWLLPIFSMLYERRVRRQFIRLHTSLTEMVKGISQITFSQTYKQQHSITKVGPKLKKMPAFSGRLYAPLSGTYSQCT
jgi:hypothetical protein